ncbi:MAG TPA: hypothetical protein VMU25_01670 [Candidatus Paceibacterota bacterium]|nr:hypothetical protein [Candidatus Paceibacterota bacterium]
MRKRILVASIVAIASPELTLAAAPSTFKDLANQIAGVLGNVTTDLIVLAIVLYFWGISSSLMKSERGREQLKQRVIWGIAIIFMAVSIWGIVRLFQGTIFGSGANPTTGIGGSGGGASNCNGFNNCSFGQLQ